MVWIASLVAASTSLLPPGPTFATTSLPAKPASATTLLVAPQPALAATSSIAQLVEDNNFGAHKRGISNETEQKTHGGSKKQAKPVDVPPPPPLSSPPTLPSLPLRPPPTSSSSRLPLASYADSYNRLSFAEVDNVHDSHNDLLSEAKAGVDSAVLASVAVGSGEELDVLGGVTAASEDSNVPAPVVAEEVQDLSVENVENVGNVRDLAENVGNIGSQPSRPSPSQPSRPSPSRPSLSQPSQPTPSRPSQPTPSRLSRPSRASPSRASGPSQPSRPS